MKRTIPPTKFNPKLTPGAATAGEVRRVAVADLSVLPNLNLRVEGTPEFDEGIAELAASIEANGFYEDKPLAGYVTSDDKVIVIDGHRRLAAVKRLNESTLDGDIVADLPVVIKPEDASVADLTIAMIQSSTGKELTMFEKGIGVKRLMADGMTKDEVARRLGVTTKSIDNYILVAGVPAKARDLLLDGKVTPTHLLRTKGDVDKLNAMVSKAMAAGRTRARDGDAAPVKPTPPSLDVKASAKDMQERFPNTMERLADEPTAPVAATDSFDVTVVKDGDMRTVLQRLAAEIRKRVPHDQGDADTAHVDAKIVVSIVLPTPKAEPKSRRRKAAADSAPEVAEDPAPTEEPDLLAHAVSDEL